MLKNTKVVKTLNVQTFKLNSVSFETLDNEEWAEVPRGSAATYESGDSILFWKLLLLHDGKETKRCWGGG